MTKKDFTGNPEFEALKDLEGLDASKLMQQAGMEPPTTDGGDPAGGIQDDPPAPPAAPPATPPQANQGQEQRDVFLKEIFGDRFKTVDEVKQANIVQALDEVRTLRQENTNLKTQLETKPKTNFATDEVALFNEFVRETGKDDYGLFRKINTSDIANMDSMDVLVTKYVFDNPQYSGKEAQVRKYFEKRYNVDPDQVDEEDLAINKMAMEQDGNIAKRSLQEVKEKLKVPEPSNDPTKPKELTPEEKNQLTTGWSNVGQNISNVLAKLKVPIKGATDPLLDYEVSESERKEIQEFVSSYAVENQMELNETNVKTISTMVYNQLMINKLPEIVHSVFERARTMTETEVHAMYSNPSPGRNNDTPPTPPTPAKTDKEKTEDELFAKEMSRY
ncbi:MAG: hypothetical protein M0R03_20440 [Novosphingobium sp.]|nr:hypothetical protein [Novosphingobium sp.]